MPREDASQCPGRQNPAETAVEPAATEQPHEADPGSTLSAPQNATDPTGAERDELRIEICRAEARVRSLELELGALHPGVGRALIEAARLQTRAAELGLFPDAVPSCRQLADAALVRASQIMVAWQVREGWTDWDGVICIRHDTTNQTTPHTPPRRKRSGGPRARRSARLPPCSGAGPDLFIEFCGWHSSRVAVKELFC